MDPDDPDLKDDPLVRLTIHDVLAFESEEAFLSWFDEQITEDCERDEEFLADWKRESPGDFEQWQTARQGYREASLQFFRFLRRRSHLQNSPPPVSRRLLQIK